MLSVCIVWFDFWFEGIRITLQSGLDCLATLRFALLVVATVVTVAVAAVVAAGKTLAVQLQTFGLFAIARLCRCWLGRRSTWE